jgi:hypothetical protein
MTLTFVLMGGFIDPKALLIFFGILLFTFIFFVSGVVNLVISIVKAGKYKTRLTEQKTFEWALISFFLSFFVFAAVFSFK